MNLSAVPDLIFVMLSLWHPVFIIIALVQYLARRHPYTARGFWLLAGCPAESEVLAALLPGFVMSREPHFQAVPSGSRTSSEVSEIPHQNHVEPEEPQKKLRDNVIALAIMKKDNGDYLFSANAIRDIVGGNAERIKGWVAEVRPQAQGQRRLERPPQGWPEVERN